MKATEIYKKHNGENSVTSLWRRPNSLLIKRLTYEDKASIKLDRQQKNINPVDYAVWGALQGKDVYRVPIVGLEDLKDSAYPLGQSRPTTDQQSNWSVATEIENCS